MRRKNEGVTLLEVLVAAAVIAIGLVGLLSAISSGLQLSQTSKETQIAVSAARLRLEEARNTPFASLLGTYGGAGQTYAVPDLPSGNVVVLIVSEQQAASLWGLGSCDLNNDGLTSATAPSAGDTSYGAYPIVARVTWASEFGAREERLSTIVVNTQ